MFRKEVMNRHGERFGELVINNNVESSKVVILFLVFFISFLFFIIFSKFNVTESVRGGVATNKSLVKITPQHQGYIKNVYVKNGDSVNVGDKLITIARNKSEMDGLSKDQINKKILLKRHRNLLSRISNIDSSAEAKIKKLKTDIENKKLSLIELEKMKVVKAEQLKIQEKKLNGRQILLKKGLIAEKDFEDSRLEFLAAKNSFLISEQEIREEKRTTSQLEGEIELVELSHEENRIDLRNQILEIEREENELNNEIEYEILARGSGYVSNLYAKVGDEVATTSEILSIYPKDVKFLAELNVPSRAIGFIREGQKVKIKIDAFPYELYGMKIAEIIDVSDINAKNNVSGELTTSQNSNFIVYAELESSEFYVNGTNYSVRPGMNLSADIVLEKISILEYLMKPIIRFSSGSGL